jgi:hypothetical protein
LSFDDKWDTSPGCGWVSIYAVDARERWRVADIDKLTVP